MPQLTLFADPQSKSLSLSPEKPKGAPRNLTHARRGDQPNLWELHHQQEDMAAASKARATAKAEGREVDAHDEDEHGESISRTKRAVDAEKAEGQEATIKGEEAEWRWGQGGG